MRLLLGALVDLPLFLLLLLLLVSLSFDPSESVGN